MYEWIIKYTINLERLARSSTYGRYSSMNLSGFSIKFMKMMTASEKPGFLALIDCLDALVEYFSS